MLRTNLPRALRSLRRSRGWRQVDLAVRAATSRQTVSRVERGQLRGVTLARVEQLAAALDGSIDVQLRWRGEQLDRLVDARHARLQEAAAAMLATNGWQVWPEVSFNHFGDRGRVDLLAFHPASGTLMVVEVKSGIGDLQDSIGRLDVKARLGRTLARSVGAGPVRAVIPAFVIGDSRHARRTVLEHATLFHRYAVRGRSALAWVRRPRMPAPSGLLWFVNLPDSRGVSVSRDPRVRKRRLGPQRPPGVNSDGSRAG